MQGGGGHGAMERTAEAEARETAPANAVVAAAPTAPHARDRGLLAIAIFKLLKSVFFFFLGVGAIHLMNKDLAEEVLRLARELRFEPESRVVTLILNHIDLIDATRLREIGFATFAYSAIALTEGVGLWLEKVWAEYLTLGLTVAFLPWELWELARRPSWFRLGLLLLNLLVLWYLIWLIRRKRLRERDAVPA